MRGELFAAAVELVMNRADSERHFAIRNSPGAVQDGLGLKQQKLAAICLPITERQILAFLDAQLRRVQESIVRRFKLSISASFK